MNEKSATTQENERLKERHKGEVYCQNVCQSVVIKHWT